MKRASRSAISAVMPRARKGSVNTSCIRTNKGAIRSSTSSRVRGVDGEEAYVAGDGNSRSIALRRSAGLMRHRINQRVDAERVAETREPVEVRAVFAFALEGVAVIGIVRDEHHQMGFVVKDRAGVWLPAVGAALRGF